MKVRARPQGYTIVEVMIFLAISGALFASAVILLGGQQQKTEFTQAIQEINSQIQDALNDVATGYYPYVSNFQCVAVGSSGPPTISSGGTNTQGTNEGCTFLGRVMHFGVAGTSPEEFGIYTVVSRRQYGVPAREVLNFSQAEPTAVVDEAISAEFKTLQNGMKVRAMKYKTAPGPGGITVGAFGFMTKFATYTSSGSNLVSGDQTVNLMPIASTSIGQTPATVKLAVDAIDDSTAVVNPGGGVIICFESGGTDQFGVITIGSNGRQLSTKLEILNATPMPADCT